MYMLMSNYFQEALPITRSLTSETYTFTNCLMVATTTTIIITIATIITTTGYKNDNLLSDNSWFGTAARNLKV